MILVAKFGVITRFSESWYDSKIILDRPCKTHERMRFQLAEVEYRISFYHRSDHVEVLDQFSFQERNRPVVRVKIEFGPRRFGRIEHSTFPVESI